MRLSTHKAILLLSVIPVLGIGAFVFYKNVFANTGIIDGTTAGLGALYTDLGPSEDSKKGLLEGFCNATASNANGFTEGPLYYAPKYSLFLATLCAPFKKSSFYNPTLISKNTWRDIINSSKNHRWNITTLPSDCDPDGSMNKCDFSALLPILFKAVMNDHSTLGLASRALTDKTDEDTIKNFSNRYFSGVGAICGSDEDYYLGPKGASNEKQSLCAHSKTFNQLQQVIQDLRQQEKDLLIINPEKFQDLNKETSCSEGDKKFETLFGCSYNSVNRDDQGANQYNLWYNEMLYYKLLITWVSQEMTRNPDDFKPLNLTQVQVEGTATNQGFSPEIQRLQREVLIAQKSFTLMQKTIANFRATFPLHIGLLAYYEDVLNVRRSMVKIYTPIHQLYYKLRNVQEKN